MDARTINRSNVILYCERWSETVDFYRRVLMLPADFENDWFVEFRLTGDSFVSIADARRASVDSSAGQGLTLTLQVDDVHAEHRRLAAAGVAVGTVRTHPWGALGFFCRDPEGYRLEFWQPLEP
ncbi:MAG: VOC family protein [Arenicellales bacterium]